MDTLTHILEMDDLHRRSIVHTGCLVIPVVITIGLRLGNPRSKDAGSSNN